jgi:predicted nucleotidyltransferase
MNQKPLPPLGEPIRSALDDLVKELVSKLGDDLAALVVYGSVARGGYRHGESDVDVAIVMKRAPREKLDTIANAVQIARYGARIEAIVLVSDEIPRAGDVFPLFYDDMKRHHILLHGQDPFAKLEIADKHRRLRIEQELREAQTRLRRAVIDALGDQIALGGAVQRKMKQVRFPLHALMTLKKVACEDSLEAVLEKSGELWHVDVAPIRNAREAAGPAHDALVALLDKAIDDVDRMEVA